MKQTTFRKDSNGNEIFVGDSVAHSDCNGYNKPDGSFQKVFILKKVNIFIDEEERVCFNLDNHCNLWKGKDCDVLTDTMIECSKIPYGKPFYFKADGIVLVSDKDYFANKCY